jgi:hypothetical protein
LIRDLLRAVVQQRGEEHAKTYYLMRLLKRDVPRFELVHNGAAIMAGRGLDERAKEVDHRFRLLIATLQGVPEGGVVN